MKILHLDEEQLSLFGDHAVVRNLKVIGAGKDGPAILLLDVFTSTNSAENMGEHRLHPFSMQDVRVLKGCFQRGADAFLEILEVIVNTYPVALLPGHCTEKLQRVEFLWRSR
ncbi:hypothetical protein [Paenirhodobacter sp.]|uniref:hypothetical protein n=1 Tax=Paenirhodobacter sp. TaxID=1965326 RepID=UPI003B40948A